MANFNEQSFTQVAEQGDAGKVILQAMIAAAAADGLISEQEKQTILSEAGEALEVQQWLWQEMDQPATVTEIATAVGNNPALASQVYLAARMVCTELDRKEIIFLSQLASALGLDDSLVEALEKQAGF